MSLTVKAFFLPARLKREDNIEEIRRFNIDKVDAGDFRKLFQKVCEVFPTLEKDETSLHWKDNDGDLIHFTTNIELAEALKAVTDGVFKLYAQERPLFKDSSELHLDVVCSNCKRPVQGSRYKCLACHDYDLCHSCELIGTHLEHTMIKIPSPNTPWLAQIMQYSYTYGPVSPVSPMLLKCRTEDGELRSALPRNMDGQSSPIMNRSSFASSIGHPYSRNEWSLFNDNPMSNLSGMSQASTMEQSYHSEEKESRRSRASDLDSHEMVGKSRYRESLFSYNGSPPDKTSGDWTILGASSKSNDTNKMTTSTTSTSIESSSSKTQVESTTMTGVSSKSEVSSVKDSNMTEMTKKDKKDESVNSCNSVDADSTVIASDGGAAKGVSTPTDDAQATDAEADTTTAAAAAPSEDTGAIITTDSVSSTTEDPKEEQATTEDTNVAKPIVDNNLYYPKIRRYADALDNLMSMGFTNEGGWLTVLVEEKRGDIIRVLDFIENNIQKCRENEQAKSRN